MLCYLMHSHRAVHKGVFHVVVSLVLPILLHKGQKYVTLTLRRSLHLRPLCKSKALKAQKGLFLQGISSGPGPVFN